MAEVANATTDVVDMENSAQVTECLPPPPSKDDPTFRSLNSTEVYFNPHGLSRTNSVYTLARASFSNQLSQLTSINLPDASSLSSTISAIPTAAAATAALGNAASQIQRWVKKAAEVLSGLDAEDDVEWAAAGAKDGLSDVEAAVGKFEQLVLVYIAAVEQVQKRSDIEQVPKEDMTRLLDTLEEVVSAWDKVNHSLKEVKKQVELAMEWEELWNVVLGEIGLEVEELSKLVFEMEEKRHRAFVEETSIDPSVGVDLKELETIVEESPVGSNAANKSGHRLSLPPPFPGNSPLASPGAVASQEDSSLLTLFARMQPLRASLDFLPMRLSSFQTRAESVLPSACAELKSRRGTLEEQYKRLEADAETLRRELGEDRWVVVFRTAGRQAQKMCESVGRGINKLCDALDGNTQPGIPAALSKKISDYEAKKNNYGPAIQKVLTVIDKGVKDRLTVNGEVLRIHSDTRALWAELEIQIKEVDAALEELQASNNQPMRDSMSSIVSNDISATASFVDTPGSSPASSVAMDSVSGKNLQTTPETKISSRRGSILSTSSSRPPTSRRNVSAPVNVNAPLSARLQHYSPVSRLSSASPSLNTRRSSATPTPSNNGRPPISLQNRPRWNSSPKVDYKEFGYAKPKTKTPSSSKLGNGSQSVYSYRTPRATSSNFPSPLGRESSASPMFARPTSSLAVRSRSNTSPSPSRQTQGGESRPRSRAYVPSLHPAPRIPSGENLKRTSLLPIPSPTAAAFRPQSDGPEEDCFNTVDAESTSVRPRPVTRPATSMASASPEDRRANGRRTSMLPVRNAGAEKEKRRWK